jgi:hypothetical protein
MFDKLLKEVKKSRKYSSLYNLPWQLLEEENKYNSKLKSHDINNVLKKFKILILNVACGGFGDIVFAAKLYEYLKKWYPCEIYIVTTTKEKFKQLGFSKNIISLTKKKPPFAEDLECKKFSNLKLESKYNNLLGDIYLVAPIISDFKGNQYNDVNKLFPNSNRFNTFYMSEYNTHIYGENNNEYNVIFPVGVGKDYLGIFFTDVKKTKKSNLITNNPYLLAYVGAGCNTSISEEECMSCLIHFLQLAIKKNDKYEKLDVIINYNFFNFDTIDILLEYRNNFKKLFSKYYSVAQILYSKSESNKTNQMQQILLYSDNKPKNIKLLTIRLLYPIPYKNMINLISNSLPHILLTGDQSLTDALSCCHNNKIIFYQSPPWKDNLANQLSKEIPNSSFLKSPKTSCGNLKQIKYKPNYEQFMKRNDFRIKGRKRLDAILLNLALMETDPNMIKYKNLILKYNGKLSLGKKQILHNFN